MQSYRLPSIIAVIDHLERRLYDGKLSDGEFMPNEKLLGLLQLIGNRYVAHMVSSDLHSLQFLIGDDLQGMLNERNEQLILSARQLALIQFVESVFGAIKSMPEVHGRVYSAIQGLQICLLRMLLIDSEALGDVERPHRKFLELLISKLIGYDDYSGQRAGTLIKDAEQRVAETTVSVFNEEQACQTILSEFTKVVHDYDHQSQVFENNLIKKEHNTAVRDDARSFIDRSVLLAINGKAIPADLVRFFQEIWSKYLHIVYLKKGSNSQAWQQGIDAIATIVKGLYIENANDMMQFYQNELSHVLPFLYSETESIYQEVHLTQRVLKYLEEFPLEVIHSGKKIDTSGFQKVPVPDPSQTIAVPDGNYPPEDQKTLDAMQIGNWYILNTDGRNVHCKLIKKEINFNYCLFSNTSGMRVASIMIRGLAKFMATGKLKLIDTGSIVPNAFEAGTVQLEELLQRLESKVYISERERTRASQIERIIAARRERLEREQLAQSKEQSQHRTSDTVMQDTAPSEVAAEQKAVEAARELHRKIDREEKALREQKKQELEAASQAQSLAEQKYKEQALQTALKAVRDIQPGGWLELLTKDNKKLECKLALKLRTTKKMIFVDGIGQKVAEMLEAELANQIVEGNAHIIDQGTDFEDTLRSLITDRIGKI
ncbi:hypothetical protein TI04_03265 [Achromatium sp. WMS2]|nr:hypothetical protein TI04_03265 [Achromatium sp. WMS2]